VPKSVLSADSGDWDAFKMINLLDDRRVMWANDLPHSDST
jgi:hypothetical protein